MENAKLPRYFRRKEEKRKELMKNKFRELSTEFAMGLMETDGIYGSESVEGILKPLEKRWKSFIWDIINKYPYIISRSRAKEDRELLLNQFREFVKNLCTAPLKEEDKE